MSVHTQALIATIGAAAANLIMFGVDVYFRLGFAAGVNITVFVVCCFLAFGAYKRMIGETK